LSDVPHELAEQPPFDAGASFNTGNSIVSDLVSCVYLLAKVNAQAMPTAVFCIMLLIYMFVLFGGWAGLLQTQQSFFQVL
jgi:hypothetical protein